MSIRTMNVVRQASCAKELRALYRDQARIMAPAPANPAIRRLLFSTLALLPRKSPF